MNIHFHRGQWERGKGDNMWNFFNRIYISIFFVMVLSGCGLYTLGVFGSCDKWEIYSEKKRITNTFKMHVCSTQFEYSSHYLSRKKIKNIQDIVYPKLKRMIKGQKLLTECWIIKESIVYQYGVAKTPIKADIICKKDIKFEEKIGRFFITSFNF